VRTSLASPHSSRRSRFDSVPFATISQIFLFDFSSDSRRTRFPRCTKCLRNSPSKKGVCKSSLRNSRIRLRHFTSYKGNSSLSPLTPTKRGHARYTAEGTTETFNDQPITRSFISISSSISPFPLSFNPNLQLQLSLLLFEQIPILFTAVCATPTIPRSWRNFFPLTRFDPTSRQTFPQNYPQERRTT